MAEHQDRKAELIAQLARARSHMEASGGSVRRALDFPTRLRGSFKEHAFAWAGGAVLAGILLAKLPRRTRKVYVDSEGQRVKKSAAGKAGLLLAGGKVAFELLRPMLTKWLTKSATPFVEKWAARYAEK
jgi:hypothetical protein